MTLATTQFANGRLTRVLRDSIIVAFPFAGVRAPASPAQSMTHEPQTRSGFPPPRNPCDERRRGRRDRRHGAAREAAGCLFPEIAKDSRRDPADCGPAIFWRARDSIRDHAAEPIERAPEARATSASARERCKRIFGVTEVCAANPSTRAGSSSPGGSSSYSYKADPSPKLRWPGLHPAGSRPASCRVGELPSETLRATRDRATRRRRQARIERRPGRRPPVTPP